MKQFNIVKQDVILWGYHIPVNACFGSFTVTYKKYIGTKQVTTKKGKVVEKPQFKPASENIIYYVDNFKPIRFKDDSSIRIHVYDKSRDKWIDTHTRAYKKYDQLHKFLLQMFVKNGFKPDRQCIYWIDYRTGRPQEKKAQIFSDSVFNTSVGYALSKNVMTVHNVNRDGWASYDKVQGGM
jgi:hypothetical protein